MDGMNWPKLTLHFVGVCGLLFVATTLAAKIVERLFDEVVVHATAPISLGAAIWLLWAVTRPSYRRLDDEASAK